MAKFKVGDWVIAKPEKIQVWTEYLFPNLIKAVQQKGKIIRMNGYVVTLSTFEPDGSNIKLCIDDIQLVVHHSLNELVIDNG